MSANLRLMLLMGRVVAAPAPAVLLDALQSVQVTSSSGSASGFQLTFAVAKRSPVMQVLLPSGALDPKTRVIVVAVVGGVPHVLTDGVVTRQELNPGTSPGTSQLTLTGEDLTVLMDLKHAQHPYPGLPFNLRAMAVCARYAEYGIIPAAVPTVISNLPDPTKKIPVQSCTDLEYLRGMATDAGYVFFLEPGPVPGLSIAYWGPEVRAGILQPALTVDSGAATNVESLTFGYDGLSRTQYTIPLTEPNTKITFQLPVPDVSLLRPPLALRPHDRHAREAGARPDRPHDPRGPAAGAQPHLRFRGRDQRQRQARRTALRARAQRAPPGRCPGRRARVRRGVLRAQCHP